MSTHLLGNSVSLNFDSSVISAVKFAVRRRFLHLAQNGVLRPNLEEDIKLFLVCNIASREKTQSISCFLNS